MLFIVPVLSTRSYTYEWHVAFEIVRNYGYRRLGIAVFWRHAKQLANLAIHLLAHGVVPVVLTVLPVPVLLCCSTGTGSSIL